MKTISNAALNVLNKDWNITSNMSQSTYQEISEHIRKKTLFSEKDLTAIEEHLIRRDETGLRKLFERCKSKEKSRLAGEACSEQILRILAVVSFCLTLMFGSLPGAVCMSVMAVVKFITDLRAKKPWVLFLVSYMCFLVFYTTNLGNFLFKWVLAPLWKVIGYVMTVYLAPLSDFAEYAKKAVSSAYSKVVEYFSVKNNEEEEGHGTNSSNTTTPRDCSKGANFSCDFKDFLDSVGGFSGMGMMFGLVTKVVLAMDGTYLIGYGPENTSSILPHNALLPTVVQQQMFHHNLARDSHLTQRVPLNLDEIGSKFETQVKKAIEDERKKVASMIAAAIEEERKKVAEEQMKNRDAFFYQRLVQTGIMTVTVNVAWEIGKHVLLNTARQYRDNNRVQMIYQVARAVLSAVPMVCNAYGPLVAGRPILAVVENVVHGASWSAVAYQVIGYVGKFIYEYALVPPYVHDAEPLEGNAAAAAGGMTRAGKEAVARAAAGGGGLRGNIHTTHGT